MNKTLAFMLTLTAGLYAAHTVDAVALAAFLPFALALFKALTRTRK